MFFVDFYFRWIEDKEEENNEEEDEDEEYWYVVKENGFNISVNEASDNNTTILKTISTTQVIKSNPICQRGKSL